MNEKNTIEEADFIQLGRNYFEHTNDIKEWFTDKDFNQKFCEVTRDCFKNNKDSGNCYIVFMGLDSIRIEDSSIRDAFEEEVQSYVGGNFEKAVELHDEIMEFQNKHDGSIDYYGEIDYGVSKETWDRYDTTEFTVDEINQLNRKMKGISNKLAEKSITQHNVDITKKEMTFSDKLKLITTLESRGYTDLKVIVADDIVEVLSEKTQPIYMQKNKGGYYDKNTIRREYHYNKTESMNDIITRDGKTGFANTIDVSYMGDFASHTYDIEYVDEYDLYKVKHLKVWDGYFRGCELDVDPSTFQKYNDFFYVVDEDSKGEKAEYLFASTGKVIDVYELDDVLLSDLVLEVVDAQKILEAI